MEGGKHDKPCGCLWDDGNKDSKPLTKAEQMRFADALKQAGYQNKLKRLEGKPTKVWIHPK